LKQNGKDQDEILGTLPHDIDEELKRRWGDWYEDDF